MLGDSASSQEARRAARALTNAALAKRVDLAAQDIRAIDPLERLAVLYEAARRLRGGTGRR